MDNLQLQLKQHGFDTTFSPELTSDWLEYKDLNLGKTSYIYQEEPSAKGLVLRFTFRLEAWGTRHSHRIS